jgi:hypothetical protein
MDSDALEIPTKIRVRDRVTVRLKVTLDAP